MDRRDTNCREDRDSKVADRRPGSSEEASRIDGCHRRNHSVIGSSSDLRSYRPRDLSLVCVSAVYCRRRRNCLVLWLLRSRRSNRQASLRKRFSGVYIAASAEFAQVAVGTTERGAIHFAVEADCVWMHGVTTLSEDGIEMTSQFARTWGGWRILCSFFPSHRRGCPILPGFGRVGVTNLYHPS